MSRRKAKLRNDGDKLSEGLTPPKEQNEGSFKKGTFVSFDGSEVEYIEDDNGVIQFMSNGCKVRVNNSPSQEACERFIRLILDIKALALHKVDAQLSSLALQR